MLRPATLSSINSKHFLAFSTLLVAHLSSHKSNFFLRTSIPLLLAQPSPHEAGTVSDSPADR